VVQTTPKAFEFLVLAQISPLWYHNRELIVLSVGGRGDLSRRVLAVDCDCALQIAVLWVVMRSVTEDLGVG
jgi:hypothetical protein